VEEYWQGKAEVLEENLSNAILSATNLTRTNRELNLTLRSEKQSTNRLGHGTTTEDTN